MARKQNPPPEAALRGDQNESSNPLTGDGLAAQLAPEDWPAGIFGSEHDAFDMLLECSEKSHEAMIAEGVAEYRRGQTEPFDL